MAERRTATKFLGMALLAWLAVPGAWADRGTTDGQALRVLTAIAPTTLDPHRAYTGADYQLLGHIYDPLLSRDLFTPVPGLLATWESNDQRVWRLQPASGRRFADGSPVTARDMVYSLCRWAALNRTVPHGQPVELRRVALAAGGTGIILELDRPQARLPSALTLIFGVKAPDGFRDTACTADMPAAKLHLSHPPRGSGPYELTTAAPDPGPSYELTAVRPPKGEAVPPFASVRLRVEPDAQARVRALADGTADIIEDPPPAPLAYLPGLNHIGLTELPTDRTLFLSINLTPPDPSDRVITGARALADSRVRRAIALSINKELLAQRATDGYGAPANQLGMAGMRGFAPARPADTYDPAAARELLRAAGFGDGLSLELLAPPLRGSDGGRTADMLAGMLSAAGIRVTVLRLERGDYRDRLREGRFDLALNMVGIEDGIVLSAFQDMLRVQAVRSAMNPGLYRDPEVTALLARGEAEPAALEEVTARIQALLDRDTPIIPLLHQRDVVLHRADLALAPRDTARIFGRATSRRDGEPVR